MGVPEITKMPANCLIMSMVWDPKQAKGAADAGFLRESANMAASVSALAEDIVGMVPLWG